MALYAAMVGDGWLLGRKHLCKIIVAISSTAIPESWRNMAHLSLVPKRVSTRHELEQQLDALACEYGVSKDKKIFEQLLEVCRPMEVLKVVGERHSLTDHQ